MVTLSLALLSLSSPAYAEPSASERIARLEAAVLALQEQVVTLEEQNADLEAQVANRQAEIDALETRVALNEGDMNEFTDAIFSWITQDEVYLLFTYYAQ